MSRIEFKTDNEEKKRKAIFFDTKYHGSFIKSEIKVMIDCIAEGNEKRRRLQSNS